VTNPWPSHATAYIQIVNPRVGRGRRGIQQPPHPEFSIFHHKISLSSPQLIPDSIGGAGLLVGLLAIITDRAKIPCTGWILTGEIKQEPPSGPEHQLQASPGS